MAGARNPITFDVDFGDAVEPGVEESDLPVLLDTPSPHLLAYPPKTVIAEKFHAMVVLSMANMPDGGLLRRPDAHVRVRDRP